MKNEYAFAILSIGIILAAVILAVNLKKETENTISVSGQSELNVPPDEAKLYLGVEITEKTVLEAQQDSTEVINKIITVLKNKGVAEKDIQTTSFSIDEQREYINDSYQLVGYKATHKLEIKTTDLESVGEIVDTAVKNGANVVDRISFDLSDQKKEEINAQALTEASSNAKEKAESLAKNLGIKLGKVSYVSEYGMNYRPYEYAGAKSSVDFETESTVIMPQEVTVSAYVSLAFKIN